MHRTMGRLNGRCHGLKFQLYAIAIVLLATDFHHHHHQQFRSVYGIDLTTTTSSTTKDYSLVSKASAITSRSTKTKILHPPLTAPASASGSSFGVGKNNSYNVYSDNGNNKNNNINNRNNAIATDERLAVPQQSLLSLSSKSYVSAPTSTTTKINTSSSTSATPSTTTSAPTAKLAKRAGSLADLKQKGDHVPDSSGHIPYRIGRPHLLHHHPHPIPDYGSSGGGGGGSSTGSGSGSVSGSGSSTGSGSGYHTLPYDPEKWHSEYWERDYNKIYAHNTTRVQHIEAECQDDYMKIRVGFNGSFSGLVYSAGYAYDPDCMYINGSGRDYYEFYIQLNRCGTLGKNSLHDDNHKNPTNFMWNTVTVQYNPLIEEEYDEHFKVTCEYGYDFWKTVTFPFLDVEVATGNPVVFTLSPPECYMEIQNGYGIGGPRVTGPVRVGDPLTLIIYMRSKYDGFDIVVNDCYAHNGANKRIQLIDEFGCPVDDKLISRFRGSWTDSGVFETQVYAYMKTFRFTGSPALYIECDVRMCHGRCPSQPCHWRNLKAVTKRDISNSTSASPDVSSVLTPAPEANFLSSGDADGEKTDPPLSENVNLFQSLRVLQEGENDGDDLYSPNGRRRDPSSAGGSSVHHTCLKTTTFSALTATFSLILCILTAALMIACARLKQRSKEASIYDTYITHKGQID